MAENNQSQPKKPLTEADIKEEPISSSQNNAIKIVLVVVGVIVLLSVIGMFLFGWAATRIGTSIFEQATNGSVQVDESGIRIADEEGEFEISSGDRELPRDFPAKIPIYEPSELMASSRMGQGDETVWSATFKTTDSYRNVSNFYETTLSLGGWEIDSTFESENMHNISAGNEALGLQLQLGILFDESDGTTGFTLTVINTEDEE